MDTERNLSHSLLSASDEIVEPSCIVCLSRDGKQVESTHFCLDCDGALCKDCTKWHQNFPATSTHQVVDVTLASGTSGKKGPLLPTERCEIHHGKLIDHFCQNHDMPCCVSCVALKHRNCLNVEYLPTCAQGMKKDNVFNQLYTSTQILLQALKQERSSRHDLLQDLNKEDIESQKLLQDLRTKLIKHLECRIKSESDIVKSEYQVKNETVQADIKVIDDQIDAVETCRKRLDEDDNEYQLFVYMKQAEESEKSGKLLINTLMQHGQTQIPQYTISCTLEQHISEIQNLGKYEMKTPGKIARAVLLVHEDDYNLTSAVDTKECDIIGMCLLPDGSVAVADYSNKCLKHFDYSYSVTQTLDMYTEPSDVCYVDNNNEMAVTFYNESKVQFVSVGETMQTTRSFQLVWPGRRICYSQNELFVCCEAKESEIVCVFNLSGQEIRKIQDDEKGQAILSYLMSLTFSSDGSKLHVADKNNVITIDRTGKLMWKYTESRLDAVGVCTLDDDSLLVSSKSTNDILHLSSDGKKLGMVLSVSKPEAVWYDSANDRVSLLTESSNILKVYIPVAEKPLY